MTHKVGPKGQVVVEKAIRDKLGVQPGWCTLQLLVDAHVELYFIPPEHERSLAGSLAKYVNRTLDTAEALRDARETVWEEFAKQRQETSE